MWYRTVSAFEQWPVQRPPFYNAATEECKCTVSGHDTHPVIYHTDTVPTITA